MKKVLSTKTLDAAMLAYAQTLQLDVQCVDFIETTAYPFTLSQLNGKNFDALVFTSANAVKYFFGNSDAFAFISGKKIFAIQGKTQDELLAFGVKTNIAAPSAQDLALAIIKSRSATDILHVCGNLRLPVMEGHMHHAGILYTDLMVYQTGTRAKKIAGGFDAVLLYSPSGIESFLTLNSLNTAAVYCCIGNTTASTLKEKNSSTTIILPEQPNPQSMLAAVSNYFQKNHIS